MRVLAAVNIILMCLSIRAHSQHLSATVDSSEFAAIYGLNTVELINLVSFGYGVIGEASVGVKGLSNASANGIGLLGVADAISGVGVSGSSLGSSARGVEGIAYASSGVGVYGGHASTSGTTAGVEGVSLSTSDNAKAIYGLLNSTSPGSFSSAVRGENKGIGTSGIGVWGSQSGSGWGVYGQSTSGNGVQGNGGSSDFWAANGTYGNSSSIRWKRNIDNIPNPLSILNQLRGVFYNWDEEHGGKRSLGFIAEEVGKVLPEIVWFEENGIDAKGMDYTKVIPLLVEAGKAIRKEYKDLIKEQQQLLASQQREIETMSQQLSEIKALLSDRHSTNKND